MTASVHHFGLLCPPGISHVTCLTAIARELGSHGHRATVFNIPDVAAIAGAEGVSFHALGAKAHPPGSFKAFADTMSGLHGIAAMRYGLKVAGAEIQTLLEEAPPAMQAAGVTALLVDQGQPAGSTIAERIGVPFVTVCNAAPANPDPSVPPSVTNWDYVDSRLGRLRNRAAYTLFDWAVWPLRRQINAFRRAWDLRPLRSLNQTFSPLLQLSQQTEEFDFPRTSLPSVFHYVGLIKRTTRAVPFPFERLTGRPVVYASLGTVAGGTVALFSMLAEACAALGVQLVITLGGRGRPEAYTRLAGDPVVVAYAPQLEILKRAAVTVCHAGNNTILESLSCGVPALAVPFNTDQYSIASRLRRSGAGESVTLSKLTPARVHRILERILSRPEYAARAGVMRDSIERAGGTRRAADLVESALAGYVDRGLPLRGHG